jgi:peptidoglycan hydrolase-like protein with peptidoglycan-binding domain
MDFTRRLELTRPLTRGEDVEAVQQRLLGLGLDEVGRADGKYGSDTVSGVTQFQRSAGLPADGVVSEDTWAALFAPAPAPREPTGDTGGGTAAETGARAGLLEGLTVDHGIFGSAQWRLTEDGIRIGGAAPETTGGRPVTVGRVWNAFGDSMARWSAHYDVPVELIIATACTETRGDPEKIRREPGFVSDEATPHRISPGLMQTLISTARDALSGQTDDTIDRAWLLVADNSIRAGTAYIGQQRAKTALDPPKVACAYNAGSVVRNDGPDNRWKMRQFPIGTSEHADRFVRWLNDAFRFFEEQDITPAVSYRELFARRAR